MTSVLVPSQFAEEPWNLQRDEEVQKALQADLLFISVACERETKKEKRKKKERKNYPEDPKLTN